MVSLIMSFMRMVDYPFFSLQGQPRFPWTPLQHSVELEAFMVEYTVFFPVLSTLTWDTLLTLRSTWGFYLNHLIPLRPFISVFDNVLLEHGGLPHVLPLAVHLIFLPEQVEGVIRF